MPRSASPKKAPDTPQKRRTQAERSDSMRDRLLKATLESLAENGYTGSTLSSIVRRAGVSRGAQVHHYPSKNALILDAAEYLMRRAYRVLGKVLLGIANEDDRLQVLLQATWKEIFDTRMYRAFFELLIASQHDKELAAALRKVARTTRKTVEQPVQHYFEPRSSASGDSHDLFAMTVLLFGAMSASSHLADSRQQTQRYLELWAQVMAGNMRARKGVSTPPPRPHTWG
jgi:AcrR family transcriptional regulator